MVQWAGATRIALCECGSRLKRDETTGMTAGDDETATTAAGRASTQSQRYPSFQASCHAVVDNRASRGPQSRHDF